MKLEVAKRLIKESEGTSFFIEFREFVTKGEEYLFNDRVPERTTQNFKTYREACEFAYAFSKIDTTKYYNITVMKNGREEIVETQFVPINPYPVRGCCDRKNQEWIGMMT